MVPGLLAACMYTSASHSSNILFPAASVVSELYKEYMQTNMNTELFKEPAPLPAAPIFFQSGGPSPATLH